jgi:hypothetical protein
MRETFAESWNEDVEPDALGQRKCPARMRAAGSRPVRTRALELMLLASLGAFAACQLDTDPWPGLAQPEMRSDAGDAATMRGNADTTRADAGRLDAAVADAVHATQADAAVSAMDAATPKPDDATGAGRTAASARAGSGGAAASGARASAAGSGGGTGSTPSAATDADAGMDDADAGMRGR